MNGFWKRTALLLALLGILSFSAMAADGFTVEEVIDEEGNEITVITDEDGNAFTVEEVPDEEGAFEDEVDLTEGLDEAAADADPETAREEAAGTEPEVPAENNPAVTYSSSAAGEVNQSGSKTPDAGDDTAGVQSVQEEGKNDGQASPSPSWENAPESGAAAAKGGVSGKTIALFAVLGLVAAGCVAAIVLVNRKKP